MCRPKFAMLSKGISAPGRVPGFVAGWLSVPTRTHARLGRSLTRLIALGPAILPLVIEKLTDPESFLALQLYDVIQLNERLLVQYGPDDERILEGEQGRARRVVQAWFANQ